MIVGFYFEEKRAFATGIAVCGSGIGTFIFAGLTNLLVKEYGWRLTVAVLAGVNFLCVFFALFFKPPKYELKEVMDDSTDETDSINETAQNNLINNTKDTKTTNDIYNLLTFDATNQNGTNKTIDNKLKIDHSINKNNRKRTDSIRSQTGRPENYRPRTMSSSSTISFAIVSLVKKELAENEETSNVGKRSNDKTIQKSDSNNNKLSSSKKDELSSPLSSSSNLNEKNKPMFDLTLLVSPTFLLFSFSGFLTLFGFFIPFTYMKGVVSSLHLPKDNSSRILQVIGITNTLGRVICGFASDRTRISASSLSNIALIIGGIFTIILPVYLRTYSLLMLFAVVFGFSIGQ